VADESAPLHPIPLVAWRPPHEQRVLEHGRGGRPIVIRPTIVYGHGGGIIANTLAQAQKGTITVAGDGSNHFSYIHVDDLGSLYAAALERGSKGIYNASSSTYTANEIANAIAKKTGAKIERITPEQARSAMGPFGDTLSLDQQISSEKAKR